MGIFQALFSYYSGIIQVLVRYYSGILRWYSQVIFILLKMVLPFVPNGTKFGILPESSVTQNYYTYDTKETTLQLGEL